MDAQETKIFLIIILLIGTIGVVFYSFFVSLQKQHKKLVALKMQNITAELNSIEKERTRTAADLHDELAPLLAAAKLKISSFDLADEEDRWQQQRTDEHLEEVLVRLRTIAHNLMPVTLQRKGLGPALREFTGYVSRRNGLQIEFTGEDVILPDDKSVHLYRIVQELVHNTAKHAGATLLQLGLRKEKDAVVLTSRDNGSGFDYQQKLREGGGFGLRNLLSRTDVLGGELFVDSKAGAGTLYVIEIPTKAV